MGRSKEKTLCWDKFDSPPPIPDETLWKESTLLKDQFWKCVMESPIKKQPAEGETPIFCHPDAPEGTCGFPDALALIRFRIEKGDMPASTIDFPSKNSKPGGWDKWFEAIDKVPDFRVRLKAAGIYDAIRVSTMNYMKRDVNAMEILVSRWCAVTHTFVAAWGEFTPTLEDVIQLLRLPVFGYADLIDFDLTPEEQAAVTFLRKTITKSSSNKPRLGKMPPLSDSRGKRPNYAAWIRVFFEERLGDHVLEGDESSSPHRLAAFIALWLSRYVFIGPPNDGLSTRVLPMAVKMSVGVRFSLAPAYLGSLYKRLDESLDAFLRSKGRYVFQCFADCNFLQMFLFEHFPEFAPEKLIHSQGGPRAWCWHKARTTSEFHLYIDDEAKFVFRPYQRSPLWAEQVESPFGKELRSGKFKHRDDTPKNDLSALFMARPYTFVALLECELPEEGHKAVSSSYNPHRVARQLGYEQGRPLTNHDLLEVNIASSSVRFAHHRQLHPDVRSLQIPSLDRQGGTSLNWVCGWNQALDGFKTFVGSPPRVIPTINVTGADHVLRLPKKPITSIPSEKVAGDASPSNKVAKKTAAPAVILRAGTTNISLGHKIPTSVKAPQKVKSHGRIPLNSGMPNTVFLRCKKPTTAATSTNTNSEGETDEEPLTLFDGGSEEEEDEHPIPGKAEEEEVEGAEWGTEDEVEDEEVVDEEAGGGEEEPEMSRCEVEREQEERDERKRDKESGKSRRRREMEERKWEKKEKERMKLEEEREERSKMEKEKEERGRLVKDREKRERLEKEREEMEMVDKEREEGERVDKEREEGGAGR